MVNEFSFPSGLAVGPAFCNRVHERASLKQSMVANQHTVLISPRRYGKTSLIFQVLHENQFPNCVIDFLPATHLNFVKNAIVDAVSSLLTQLLPLHKKLGQKLIDFFANLNPKIVLSAGGQHVELAPQLTAKKTIVEALLNLDELAKSLKTRIVMVLDEFQQISTLSESHEIEASLRHVVERSQYVTYIFSGSNRHLLNEMFNDKKRPFYHLCELTKLDRITKNDYSKFIQNAAQKKWKKKIAEDAVQEILDLTQCHTYYVNALCRQLWKLSEVPNVEQIKQQWQKSVQEQYPWIASDVGGLSINQRIVLAALAFEPMQELQGRAFCKRVDLTPASVKRAVDFLSERDFIFQDADGYYRVLDPAIFTYLRQITFFDFNEE